MGIFEMLSALSLVPLVGMVVFLPLVVYLMARARDAREGRGVDPQLGAKTALGFFQTLGFMALLAGTAALITGVASETRFKELWAPIAMLVVGGLFFGLHTALLARTNQAERTAASRLYWGMNYISAGAASFVSLSLLIVAIGRGRFDREDGYAALAMALVYLPTWIVLTIRLLGNPRDTPRAPDAPATPSAT